MWSRCVVRGSARLGRAQSSVAHLRGILKGELESIKEAGTWKKERIITSKQGAHITVEGSSTGILNFCANNYLGLSSHPEVIRAGHEALEKFGAGLSSVRFICGTQKIEQFLEYRCFVLGTMASKGYYQGSTHQTLGTPAMPPDMASQGESLEPIGNPLLREQWGQDEVLLSSDREEKQAEETADESASQSENIHKRLEEKIAQFHKKEDAILYISCFDANAGIFEALLTPEDAVLSDELNHASIIDGIRLCKANKYRYKHMDLDDLEAKLKEAQKHRLRLIATDGVFSMDGDIAPLSGICDLAKRYNALVFIDECHATGFMGPNGRGTDELLGVMDQVTIVNSTLGKALGGAAGGYTTGPKPLIDLLRQRSRPYLFSNTLPPAVVGSASKALDLLMENNTIAQSMTAKTARFRNKMAAAGFTISGNDHPICPVMLGDARLAAAMADDMLERGIYVIGFSYPVVPKGKARIRVQISAAHSDEDIDTCVKAFTEVGRKYSIVP